MVLESLINPFKAENKPARMFFIGFLYATVAVFLSIWIFKSYSSLVMVFLTVIVCVPLMYNTLKSEEKKDMVIKQERKLLSEHKKVLFFLMFLFLGFLVAFSIWYIVLPADLVEVLFSSQRETIDAINSRITGGGISSISVFIQILLNNTKVMMFCIFFAFFYGAGAIFILTWNATVISAAVGTFIKNKIAEIGSTAVHHYFHVFPLGIMRYMIHGVPEIGAYFIGGMAGGIISVAMVNHDLESDKFRNIIFDALNLFFIGMLLLIIGSLIEVYITPVFF